MNVLKRMFLLVALTILAVNVGFTQDFQEVELRTWTSISGNEIEAEIIEFKSGKVTLKSSEGKIFQIPLEGLAASDQEFVRQAQSGEQSAGNKASSAKSGGETESVNDARLPSLTNGDWTRIWRWGKGSGVWQRRIKGSTGVKAESYAVYKCPAFTARVDIDGALHVIPIKAGEPMDLVISIHHLVRREPEEMKEGKKVKSGQAAVLPNNVPEYRKFERFTEFPEPQENPSSITLKGVYEDNVPWECTYEFKDNTITYWGKITPPSGLEYPAAYVNVCSLSASHEFDPTATVDEQRRQTSGCSLSVVFEDKKSQVYDYVSLYKLRRLFRKAEVKGHFAPYVISLDAVDVDNLPLIQCYPDVSLFKGYAVWSRQNYDTSSGKYRLRDRAPKVRITIK